MNRDIVCLIRLTFDSLPEKIRNSKILFRIAQLIFGLPESLYEFRKNFDEGKIKNLKHLYVKKKNTLKKISNTTDINSLHLNLIFKYLDNIKFNSVLDIGCGNGFLLKAIKAKWPNIEITGLDYNIPKSNKILATQNNNINFLEGEVNEKLRIFKDISFDIVICTHMLEHLKNPQSVILEVKKIAKKRIILICPLEKKLKWGINYHINFFQNENCFLENLNLKYKNLNKYNIHKRLGDLMYIEFLENK